MLVNGLTKRSFAQRDSFSFLLDLSINEPSGVSRVGFSGDSELSFEFNKGRILDPEGNFVYAYQPNSLISISGSVNTGSYNYWCNGEYIAEYPKNPAIFEYLYADTNVGFSLNSYVRASGQTVEFDTPSSFNTGQDFSFNLRNMTPEYAFRVFSGQLEVNGASSVLFDFTSGAFPKTITNTSPFYLKDFGASMGVNYEIEATLFTNQGNISTTFNVIDEIPNYSVLWDFNNLNNSGNGNFFYDTNNAANLTTSSVNSLSFGNFSLSYYIDNKDYPKNLNIWLVDSGNNTGDWIAPYATRVDFYSYGSGYSGVPTAFFDNGASGIVSLTSGVVSSLNISYPGTGFSTTFYLTGGTPLEAASGVAILSGYERNFFNNWGLYTGLDSSSLTSGYTGINSDGRQYFYTNAPFSDFESNLFITVKNKSYYSSQSNTASYAFLYVSGVDYSNSVLISGGYII